MSEDQFTKLFTYMERRFADLEFKLDAKADKVVVDRMLAALDHVLKRLESNEQERLVILHQLARHEQWIDQLAAGTGVSLAPG